ncbi:MAG: hypothetical protein DMG11_33595, partial [Acidobacteria bacterium]
MGEVYRARDAKLKREVAIKILPGRVSTNPQHIARFQREAEVLASLNHTNIAGIYDLQETGDSRYLVLEFVEGETLQHRLGRGLLPLDEALSVARQICHALGSAHEKGVVHLDLKPANIMMTSSGRVKLLDFGLASMLRSDATTDDSSNLPTVTGTREGVIAGTPAYMSPEQARGKPTDKRTDMWAFGCV